MTFKGTLKFTYEIFVHNMVYLRNTYLVQEESEVKK